VLLDEPHTSLDLEGVELLHDALGEHVDAGGAAVWCAPTVEEVAIEADLSYMLVDGRVTPS
jgi:ABC-type transport system involved in cytochrome c biogenesis ATPase subunit